MTDDPSARIVKAEEMAGLSLRRLFADARIVRREVVRDSIAVREALDEAKTTATAIREAARLDGERIREAARREGYEEGVREALTLVASAEVARADARRAAEREMVELAFQLAERVVGRVLETDDSAFADLVAERLTAAQGATQIVVRIAPDAANRLDERRAELAERVDGVPVTFERDASLRTGDCVIETDRGRVDARVTVQFEALREALTERGDDV